MHRFRLLLVLALASAANLYAAGIAAADAPANPAYILVTGFEPFGGDKTNGSWEAVRHLQGKQFPSGTVVVSELPVVWDKAGQELRGLILKYHPRAVIAFGQAGAEPVRLELIAHNVTQRYPDNRGALPPQPVISATGPASAKTALDVDSITKALGAAGIPVVKSSDAGGYLCNETFFVLMSDPGPAWALAMPRGFVHVPPLDAVVTTADGKRTVFDQKTLAAAADAVVASVAGSLPAK
ncbi:MAG: hypothetical protein ACHQAZ_02445 [Gammaproteobacteria bacterium]